MGFFLFVVVFVNVVVFVLYWVFFCLDVFVDVVKGNQFFVQFVVFFYLVFYGNVLVGYFVLLNIDRFFKLLGCFCYVVDDVFIYIGFCQEVQLLLGYVYYMLAVEDQLCIGYVFYFGCIKFVVMFVLVIVFDCYLCYQVVNGRFEIFCSSVFFFGSDYLIVQ